MPSDRIYNGSAYVNGYHEAKPILGPDGRPLHSGPNPGSDWQRREAEYGPYALPHVTTFATMMGRAWRTYWMNRHDEALKHGREEALAMRRDAYLMGLLQERKLATASLRWRIKVDSEKDPRQKAIKTAVQRVIEATPRLQRLMYYLLEGIWYGRYASQLVYHFDTMNLPDPRGSGQEIPQRVMRVKHHQPVNGDKIDFQWDGTPYVLVHGAESQVPVFGPRGEFVRWSDTIVTQGGGRALLIGDEYWRSRFIIHTHEVLDADYFDYQSASAIHGVGIRSVLFWLNWLRQEWLANIADWCQRTGLGVRLWYYQGGNPKSREAVEAAAKAQSDKTNILIPRFNAGGGQALEGVDYVDTASTGADLLLRLQEHVEQHLERYVIGQTLSSSTEGNGLGGTGVAEMHADTKSKIVAFDANNLADTLTEDYLGPTIKWSWPWVDFPVRLAFDIDQYDPGKVMEAVDKAFSMGVDFRETDVRGLTTLPEPQEGDRTLREAKAEMQQMEMQQQQAAQAQMQQQQMAMQAQQAQQTQQVQQESSLKQQTQQQAGESGATTSGATTSGGNEAVNDEEGGGSGDEGEPDYTYGEDENGRYAIDPETGEALRGDMPDLYPEEGESGSVDATDVAHADADAAGRYSKGERWDATKHPRGQSENAGQFGPGGASSGSSSSGETATDKGGQTSSETGGQASGQQASGQTGSKKPVWQRDKSRTGKPVWVHTPTGRRYYQERQPGQGRQLSPEAQRRKEERENAPPVVSPIGDRTKGAFRDFFGKEFTVPEIQELGAKLIGAPRGMELTVARNGDRDEIFFSGESHQVSYISRTLKRNTAGELVMSNNMFFLKPLHQGSGLGTDVFSDEVRACADAGVAEIQTVAGKDRTMNGYYTWPRLGYDAPIPSWSKNRLPATLQNCNTVQDLYTTEEGRAWWKKHGDTTPMTFDLRPGSRSLKVLNSYLASKGKQAIPEPTPEQWQEKRDKQARGQGKAEFGGVAKQFGIDEVAWEHFAEKIFNDKMARYNENPAGFGTGRPAAMWADAYRESAQNLIRNPDMAFDAPDKDRDKQRQRITGGRLPTFMSQQNLDAEAVKHFKANPHGIQSRDFRWGYAYSHAYQQLVHDHYAQQAQKEQQSPQAQQEQQFREAPAQYAADSDFASKHPRDDAGRFKEKLSSMDVGDLRRVGGWLVRRLGDDKYRIDTDDGHVVGGAERIERHIDRHKKRARLEGKSYQAAVKRGDSAGDAPDILVDAERAKTEAERFHALPHGARVVSLADDTWGRLGTIERDKKAERNRVKLDGEPGYVSEWVEPLEEGLSWRGKGEGEKVSWKKVTGETKEGLFLEKDNGTAIIKMADGKLQAVNDENNTLEMLATAKSLLKSGKLHARDKSLLRSAVERAEAGDFTDLPDRLKRAVEIVAKQDATNKEQNEQGEKEDLRIARAYIDQYETPERIRKELSRIDEERNKHSKSKSGQIVSFGGTHDSMRTVMDRKHRLEMALAILEDKKPVSDLRDDEPKAARDSLFAELEQEIQRDLFGDEPEVRQATLFQRTGDVGRYGKDAGAGRWITIGAEEGEDGKKHGGSPVYIENGRITKGAPSLVGRNINSLEVPEEAPPELTGTKRQQAGQKAAKTRTENEREAQYQRAVWAKKARKEGIDPKHLHQLAADLLAHHGAFAADRATMLKEARAALDEFGGKHRTLAASRGRGGKGEIGDATEIPGIDQVAEWAAGKYPHLFSSTAGGGVDDQLFGMLSGDDGSGADGKEGWSEADAYEQAFEHLVESKDNSQVTPSDAGGGDWLDDWEEPDAATVGASGAEDDDAVPFSRTHWTLEAD